ncbi:ATP synthase F1 subunit delta [Funiculus sociatus GB2-A5]|jgi:F-type H+-transporting ATPase subunit delta|uniref:ATP synthase subunit delta n=1 Tax=Funiculus sociatus GB2-A5 TaxID=2933946 RepID=A0ABV0JX09_9CYAN|nr:MULTISPECIES: ATP synthase F1 subunit delta [unclassified Trichocoleus]MBD1906051.1 F0F1 ATP synthase subunit delta [Trichocoleus sp. FACHB-832]MBD2062371.1 F0F1 ATP synthase subunit delta [Trichocoleus sp. FACHB-6]
MKGSMLSAEIAEPYAEALMSLAQSQNQVDRFGEDVRSLLSLLDSSPDLQEFLGNPVLSAENKKAVLRQIAGDGLHPTILNFLMLLVDRRRIIFVGGVLQHFQALLRKLNQTVLAEVTSAVELNDAQRQAISEKVKAISGAHQVELATKLNPELIGGVIIKVGSQVIDTSLRGQLRRIGLRLGRAA